MPDRLSRALYNSPSRKDSRFCRPVQGVGKAVNRPIRSQLQRSVQGTEGHWLDEMTAQLRNRVLKFDLHNPRTLFGHISRNTQRRVLHIL